MFRKILVSCVALFICLSPLYAASLSDREAKTFLESILNSIKVKIRLGEFRIIRGGFRRIMQVQIKELLIPFIFNGTNLGKSWG